MKSKKTILITGGNGYLSKEFIKSCDLDTTNFILVDIHDLCSIQEDNITYFKCDLTDMNQRNSLIYKLQNKKINVLINNAAFVGTSNLKGWNTDFDKQSLDTWSLCFEVNVTAVFHLCRDLFPILKKYSNSSIINISSMYGSLKHNKSYYKDLDISNKISDWFIPLLLLMILALPVIIYSKQYNLALIIASIISIVQIYALVRNVIKYPL